MNHSLRTAILIVAAMVASALIVAGLFGAIWNVNLLGKGPADFLPKEGVHAVIFHPTEHSLRQFPFIEEQIPTDTQAIAIFESFDAVIFSADPTSPYTLNASSPEVLQQVHHQQDSLNTDTTFRKLAIEHGYGTPWTYLPSSSLQRSVNILSRIGKALLVEDSNAIAVTYDGDAIHIAHTQERSGFANTPMRIPNMPDAFLRASGRNFAGSFYTLMNNLPEDDAVILEGVLATTLTTLGERVSFRYDLLPLLEQPSTIQIDSSGSLLNVLIDGSMDDTIQLQTILDRVHTAYENSLPSSTITKRILDKRFSSIDIRHDDTMLERNQYTTNGWLIRSTMLSGRKRGLVTATRGSAYLLSSTAAAITHAIAHQSIEEVLYSTKIVIDLSKIDEILPYLAITQKDIHSRFGTGTLTVTSKHEGIIRKVSLKTSKNPLQLLEILGE